MGDNPLIGPNVVVGGDSFGNGHFLTSGGAMTGMIGHSYRVLQYWQQRDAGEMPPEAIRKLADAIKQDTYAWLEVSAKEYSQALPINFGAERGEQIAKSGGLSADARAAAIDAARRQRHGLIPLNPSDWRRLFVHNGKVISELPELTSEHPLNKPERAMSLVAVLKNLPPRGAEIKPEDLETLEDQSILDQLPAPGPLGEFTVSPVITQANDPHELAQDGRTRVRAAIRIGNVENATARSYPQPIIVVNNRSTPDRSDDLFLFVDRGPLIFDDKEHTLTTDDQVHVKDLQSKPRPVEVWGTGMRVDLIADPPAKGAPNPHANKNKNEPIRGVKRVTLNADVLMFLFADGQNGFMGGSHDPKNTDQKPEKSGRRCRRKDR